MCTGTIAPMGRSRPVTDRPRLVSYLSLGALDGNYPSGINRRCDSAALVGPRAHGGCHTRDKVIASPRSLPSVFVSISMRATPKPISKSLSPTLENASRLLASRRASTSRKALSFNILLVEGTDTKSGPGCRPAISSIRRRLPGTGRAACSKPTQTLGDHEHAVSLTGRFPVFTCDDTSWRVLQSSL